MSLLDESQVRDVAAILARLRQERGVLDPRAVASALQLLEAVDRDAEVVLRGSSRAAERVRWALGPSRSGDEGVARPKKKANALSAATLQSDIPSRGVSLIHAGRLALVAAATVCAGGAGLASALRRVLSVVAVADALRQFAAAGGTVADLRAWWRSIRDLGGLGVGTLSARYASLRELVEDVADLSAPVDWQGMRGPRVVSLTRHGDELEVVLDAAWKSGIEIVLESVGEEPVVLSRQGATDRTVRVRLPADALVGVVGVDSAAARAVTEKGLEGLARRLKKLDHPCLGDEPVPFGALPGPLSPRALFAHSLGDARPAFIEARLTPERFDRGQTLTVTYRTTGADRVSRDGATLPTSGRIRVVAPTDVAPFEVRLTAERLATDGVRRETDVVLTARPRARIEQLLAWRTADGLRANAVIDAGPQAEVRWLGDGRPLAGPVETNGRAHTLFAKDTAVSRVEVLVGQGAVIDDRKATLPSAVPASHRLRVVLLSAIHVDGSRIHRVARAEAMARTERAAAERGVAIEWLEHPFPDDACVMLPDFVASPTDPAVREGLARLALLALRTVGWEDALYVLVVPSRPGKLELARMNHRSLGTPVFASRPCCAAEQVVVASLEALPQILDLPKSAVPDEGPCLRILGHMDDGGELCIDASRLETRRARKGVRSDALQAILVDHTGASRATADVDVLDSAVEPRFVALVPIDRNVEQVRIQRAATEGLLRRAILAWTDATLREGTGALARTEEVRHFDDDVVVARPPGELALEAAIDSEADAPRLGFRVHHARGMHTTVSVEVSSGDAFAEVLKGVEGARCEGTCDADDPTCRIVVALTPWRWRFDGTLRVVASDGWNTSATELSLAPAEGHVVIRQVDDNHFVADVGDDEGDAPRWRTSKIDHRGAVVKVENVRPETLRVEVGGVADQLSISPRSLHARGLP